MPATTAWNTTAFAANYFVPLTDEHLKTKIAAFACYEHEIQPFPHPWSERGLRLLAEYHGMQAGCGLAEAFHLMRGYPRGLPD
ncbi:MAG: hypothetical protein HZA58_00090 [Acidimicrobiia bacterium]|nr:hypothetical protein [Acidimicrobiia bacterium]